MSKYVQLKDPVTGEAVYPIIAKDPNIASYSEVAGSDTVNPMGIAYGGTGATTASGALSNLGVGDYIVECGTSGNWIYEKRNSGIVKMYYNGTYSSTFDNGNYFGAYRGTVQTIQFPFTLQDVIYAHAHHIPVNTGFALVSSYTTSSCNIYPYNRTQLTDVQTGLIMMVEVVGRWK